MFYGDLASYDTDKQNSAVVDERTEGSFVPPAREPLDRYPYQRHPDSRPFGRDLEPGTYVYVVDDGGLLWVAPDGPHMHPMVLGGARSACGAGELIVESNGVIVEVNNLSGTFQFGPETLEFVVEALTSQGGTINPAAVRAFRWDQ